MPDDDLDEEEENEAPVTDLDQEVTSVMDGEEVLITFHNRDPQHEVHVFWDSPDGKEVPMAVIAARKSYILRSFPTHSFILRDGPSASDRLIKRVTATHEASQNHEL